MSSVPCRRSPFAFSLSLSAIGRLLSIVWRKDWTTSLDCQEEAGVAGDGGGTVDTHGCTRGAPIQVRRECLVESTETRLHDPDAANAEIDVVRDPLPECGLLFRREPGTVVLLPGGHDFVVDGPH